MIDVRFDWRRTRTRSAQGKGGEDESPPAIDVYAEIDGPHGTVMLWARDEGTVVTVPADDDEELGGIPIPLTPDHAERLARDLLSAAREARMVERAAAIDLAAHQVRRRGLALRPGHV